MIRAFFLVTLLAAAIAEATWLADHPGRLDIAWRDYRITMGVSVLASLVAATSILASSQRGL
ncbi:MAG: hypothetical protein V1253_00770 [Alphaproteobacteria bacterium]|nr:hypothetical protein [Alphaproteobacteria bacterium]MDP7586264.1 hypothetical protein [Verrucomicrobiota bacterium]MDP7669169.1 hypothetical protein [Alphaproteobacteria bacterium]MEE1561731.1 hypothetical protein [Alphaproteobacteria bacterium]MEE1568328.1 hypothetical protein [Alphaproteobacteria bacterium]